MSGRMKWEAEALSAESVARMLEENGISVRAVAASADVSSGHLRRVLCGERPGSRALLQAVVDAAETMTVRQTRSQDGVQELVAAAEHMFFLNRGLFQSPICARVPRRWDAEEEEML